MPSHSKRKHHGFPLHSSDGDLPLASSAYNRQDAPPSLELSHRKHAANGKENLTLIETLPFARTLRNGVPAENSCHEEALARTSDDRIPAENSCHGETLNATDSSMNNNGKSAYHAGYGGIQNGGTAHGNVKQLCSIPDCTYSGILHRPNKDAEAISNLKQLNKQLLQQVCSLRSRDSLLHDQLKVLQVQLEENTARADALIAEKSWLEDQKVKFEIELKASREKVTELALEKSGLLEEKRALIASINGMKRDLSECKETIRQTGEMLKDSTKDLALAEEKVQSLEVEVQVLHVDQLKWDGEINALQMQKSEVQCAMTDLRMENESLSTELRSMQDTCAVIEMQAAEANQVKEALEAKLASRSLQREGFQMQLKGAWQQIQSLESQQEVSMAEKFNFEEEIHLLVRELADAHSEREETHSRLEVERKEKVSLQGLLQTADENCKGLKVELNEMNSSMRKLQTGAKNYQQHIVSLEAQLDSLVKEIALLEETKGSLKEELEQLKFSLAEASVSSKNELKFLKDDIRKLETALSSSTMYVINEGKCVSDLNSELKELRTSLKKKRGLAEMSISLAAVSISSLVVIGTMYLWKKAELSTV